MNLLLDPWVPVLTPTGAIRYVTVLDIPGSNFVEVAHPRADYSAVITELLVCLFQTLCAPESDAQRLSFLSGKELPDLSNFPKYAEAFEVLGAGVRFLQTSTALATDGSSAAALIFEAPEGQTLKHNKDFFVSREAVRSICPNCAPAALFMNQSHARMGGSGYKTGPRAVSVLTALVEGGNLWKTICLNLLTRDWFVSNSGVDDSDLATSFPWLSDKWFSKKQVVPLSALGTFGVLWWTPVGLRLVERSNEEAEPCSICGAVHAKRITAVSKVATPTSLVGSVRHPHTGWNPDGNQGAGRSVEVPKSGYDLEVWQALTVGAKIKDSVPAYSQVTPSQASRVTLHLFGYAMSQNSPEFWLDERAPVIVPEEPDYRDDLRESAMKLIRHASAVVDATAGSLNSKVQVSDLKKIPFPLKTTVAQARLTLWRALEPLVYKLLRDTEEGQLPLAEFETYKQKTWSAAIALFDKVVDDREARPEVIKAFLARRAKLVKLMNSKK